MGHGDYLFSRSLDVVYLERTLRTREDIDREDHENGFFSWGNRSYEVPANPTRYSSFDPHMDKEVVLI